MNENITRVDTVSKLRHQVSTWRAQGLSIALVPTMGALHEGHLSLVDLAHKHCDRVIVSIFVNPTQFAPYEDFTSYPRNFEADAKMLKERGTHLIYQPRSSEMYGENETTRVRVGKLSEGLCSETRPHFFEGVATVVCKLLMQAGPDIAVFGEKDYQQLLIIQAMVRDLCVPTKIIGGKLVRETDGLAMSSRNEYLSTSDRATATQLFKTLQVVAKKIENGDDIAQALTAAKNQLVNQGFIVDYLELRDETTLDIVKNSLETGTSLRIFAAVTLGKTRLIDNLSIANTKT